MIQQIRVVIAEDHYLFREGTRQLLESTGKVKVVASVADGASLLEAVNRLEPDAVVVDIRMPPEHKTEGIEAARTIRASHPKTGVVVLSQYANALYAFELFQDGTAGLAYLLKDRVGDLDELLRAVTTVTEGGSIIDPQVVDSLLARGKTITKSPIGELTERETDVIREMAQGKSNQSPKPSTFPSRPSRNTSTPSSPNSSLTPLIQPPTVASPPCSHSSAVTTPPKTIRHSQIIERGYWRVNSPHRLPA